MTAYNLLPACERGQHDFSAPPSRNEGAAWWVWKCTRGCGASKYEDRDSVWVTGGPPVTAPPERPERPELVDALDPRAGE